MRYFMNYSIRWAFMLSGALFFLPKTCVGFDNKNNHINENDSFFTMVGKLGSAFSEESNKKNNDSWPFGGGYSGPSSYSIPTTTSNNVPEVKQVKTSEGTRYLDKNGKDITNEMEEKFQKYSEDYKKEHSNKNDKTVEKTTSNTTTKTNNKEDKSLFLGTEKEKQYKKEHPVEYTIKRLKIKNEMDKLKNSGGSSTTSSTKLISNPKFTNTTSNNTTTSNTGFFGGFFGNGTKPEVKTPPMNNPIDDSKQGGFFSFFGGSSNNTTNLTPLKIPTKTDSSKKKNSPLFNRGEGWMDGKGNQLIKDNSEVLAEATMNKVIPFGLAGVGKYIKVPEWLGGRKVDGPNTVFSKADFKEDPTQQRMDSIDNKVLNQGDNSLYSVTSDILSKGYEKASDYVTDNKDKNTLGGGFNVVLKRWYRSHGGEGTAPSVPKIDTTKIVTEVLGSNDNKEGEDDKNTKGCYIQ